MITKDKLPWCLNNFSQLLLNEITETIKENSNNDAGA